MLFSASLSYEKDVDANVMAVFSVGGWSPPPTLHSNANTHPAAAIIRWTVRATDIISG